MTCCIPKDCRALELHCCAVLCCAVLCCAVLFCIHRMPAALVPFVKTPNQNCVNKAANKQTLLRHSPIVPCCAALCFALLCHCAVHRLPAAPTQ
jgi:hypothetical protein